MNFNLKEYLGPQNSLEERLFYISTFLAALSTAVFSALGVLIRLNAFFIVFSLLLSVISVSLFFLEKKYHKTKLFIHLFLFLCYIIVFPIILISARFNIIEIPLYYLVGIIFSLVLLTGKQRIIYVTVQLIYDFVTLIVSYIYFDNTLYNSERSLFTLYLRIMVAMYICSVICGLLIYYRNLVLEKELREKEIASEKADAVSYAKDMFLVNVSHEIRTPLNAIIGTTEVVLDSDSSTHIKEMAHNISNSSHALLSITSDLLDFSRMNIDTLTLVNEKYDFSVMLNDIVNLLNVRLLDSNVDFFVDVNPDIPKLLYGDSGKIRQVLINILSNAIKYTKAGSMTLKVDFEPREDNFINLKASVTDTGIGIKPEYIDKIFEPLHRSGVNEVDHSIEGNGLGLALCKKLCAAMDGKIYCESQYGEGSTFFFEVSQKVAESERPTTCGNVDYPNTRILFFTKGVSDLANLGYILDRMQVPNHEAMDEKEFVEAIKADEYDYYLVDGREYENIKGFINTVISDWRKLVVLCSCNYSYSGEPFEYVITKPVSVLNLADLINHTTGFALRKQSYEGEFTIPDATILVIDDNLVNLDVASNLLSRYKCKIILAASGKEGLIALETEKCDLVFLDYMMPDMDGIDTLKQIRKIEDPAISNIPVICLTANVVSGAREMFINEGFNDYLSKPLEVDRLERALTEFLPKDLIRYNI